MGNKQKKIKYPDKNVKYDIEQPTTLPIGNDYLNMTNSLGIENKLDSADEKIVFSVEVLKCNRFGKW